MSSSSNMSTDTYRTHGRTVDETEIERAKIHEAAETKRKAIEERERTKRERIEQWGPAPPLVFGAIALVGIIAAGIVANAYVDSKAPARPEPCAETVEVITKNDSVRGCHGGWAESRQGPGPNEVTVSCRCGFRPAMFTDGGTP